MAPTPLPPLSIEPSEKSLVRRLRGLSTNLGPLFSFPSLEDISLRERLRELGQDIEAN